MRLLFLFLLGWIAAVTADVNDVDVLSKSDVTDEILPKAVAIDNVDEVEDEIEDEEFNDISDAGFAEPDEDDDDFEDDEILKATHVSNDPWGRRRRRWFRGRIIPPVRIRVPPVRIRVPNPVRVIRRVVRKIPTPRRIIRIIRIPKPRLPFPRVVGKLLKNGVRFVKKHAKAVVGQFKKVHQVVKVVKGAVKKINWKKIGNRLGKIAKGALDFLKCAIPGLDNLLNGCLKDLTDSGKSCFGGGSNCHIKFGGQNSKCLRLSRTMRMSKSYGPFRFRGVAKASLGLGVQAFLNNGKMRVTLYGHIDVTPKVTFNLNRRRGKSWKRRFALMRRPIRIFKKMIVLTVGNVPMPVLIEITAQPVAHLNVKATVRARLNAVLQLRNPARLALDQFTIEYDPARGKPTIKVGASQNLNNLRLAPSFTITGTATLTARFRVGVEIAVKINGVPFKAFPNFEMLLTGKATARARFHKTCVTGHLALSTKVNFGVVPDVKSLTSVASNFNSACSGVVDGICKLNPAISALKCIHKKADVCQHARNGCFQMAEQLAKIPNPIQKNPFARMFKLWTGASKSFRITRCYNKIGK